MTFEHESIAFEVELNAFIFSTTTVHNGARCWWRSWL